MDYYDMEYNTNKQKSSNGRILPFDTMPGIALLPFINSTYIDNAAAGAELNMPIPPFFLLNDKNDDEKLKE